MGTTIRSYRDLIAWQKAVGLCVRTYRETERFPGDERFGLTSQMRRAAVAVPSDIAEGYGRGSAADYLRMCRMSRGSLYELDTQAHIARELGYLSETEHAEFQAAIDESSRILAGLIRSVEASAREDL